MALAYGGFFLTLLACFARRAPKDQASKNKQANLTKRAKKKIAKKLSSYSFFFLKAAFAIFAKGNHCFP